MVKRDFGIGDRVVVYDTGDVGDVINMHEMFGSTYYDVLINGTTCSYEYTDLMKA